MGSLTWAGALSGAGNAAKESLMESQKQEFAKSIEASRQQMENLRQERNLEAQRGMHTETLSATAQQGQLTRAQQQTLQTENLGAQKERQTEQIGAQKELQGTQIKSAEKISENTIKSTEDIHKATNAVTLAVARIHAAAAKTTAGASNIQVLQKELADQRHQLSLLEVEANKILSDPDSPSGRRITMDIDNARASIAQDRAYLDTLLKVPPVPTVKKTSSFSYPQGMAPTNPGLVNEAQMMQKAIAE